MKKLLILLDNYAMDKLDNLANRLIIKLKLEEKDRPTAYEKPKLRTVYPENRMSRDEWFREYRVSMLYGRDKVTHIG